MTIYFDSNHFKKITYIKKYCVPSFMLNKPSLHHFVRENAKNAKQPKKRNFACNFKHMTTVFDSKHFNTIIYNILYCVPSFIPNAKQPLKCNLARNFKPMTIFFF